MNAPKMNGKTQPKYIPKLKHALDVSWSIKARLKLKNKIKYNHNCLLTKTILALKLSNLNCKSYNQNLFKWLLLNLF